MVCVDVRARTHTHTCTWVRTASWFAIVPVATNSAASLPHRSATCLHQYPCAREWDGREKAHARE